MSVTVYKLDGNMSLYIILYPLSLSKINLTKVSLSKLSPILGQMSFDCLCRWTFNVSKSVMWCSVSLVSVSSNEWLVMHLVALFWTLCSLVIWCLLEMWGGIVGYRSFDLTSAKYILCILMVFKNLNLISFVNLLWQYLSFLRSA